MVGIPDSIWINPSLLELPNKSPHDVHFRIAIVGGELIVKPFVTEPFPIQFSAQKFAG